MTSKLRVQDLGLTIEDLREAARASMEAENAAAGNEKSRAWHRGRKNRFRAAARELGGGERPGGDQQLVLEDVAWGAIQFPSGSDARNRFAGAMELLADAKG